MSTLVTIKRLKVHFPVGKRRLFLDHSGVLKAVNDLDLTIKRGETLGLVGESGSGKTTLGRAIIRALEPTDGEVIFHIDDKDVNVTKLSKKNLRPFRRHMQMIFQDPFASLNPRMTVLDIIGESLITQTTVRGNELRERVMSIAEKCGLSREQIGRHPHAFSGGQRQRIAIARALILNPRFVVCDEPVSALDVSIQAQILNLMQQMRSEFGLTYLFIAHNLAVVSRTCERVAVMYLGKIVEIGKSQDICFRPQHPYSVGLIAAIPIPNPKEKFRPVLLKGERPDPANPPPGCSFNTRCAHVTEQCRIEAPHLTEISPGHFAACHLFTSTKP